MRDGVDDSGLPRAGDHNAATSRGPEILGGGIPPFGVRRCGLPARQGLGNRFPCCGRIPSAEEVQEEIGGGSADIDRANAEPMVGGRSGGSPGALGDIQSIHLHGAGPHLAAARELSGVAPHHRPLPEEVGVEGDNDVGAIEMKLGIGHAPQGGSAPQPFGAGGKRGVEEDLRGRESALHRVERSPDERRAGGFEHDGESGAVGTTPSPRGVVVGESIDELQPTRGLRAAGDGLVTVGGRRARGGAPWSAAEVPPKLAGWLGLPSTFPGRPSWLSTRMPVANPP